MHEMSYLLALYGWPIVLLGLLGTVFVGFLKKPLNVIISKKFPPAVNPIKEESFDTIGFLVAFSMAVIISAIYSTVTLFTSTTQPVDSLTFAVIFAAYSTNLLGVWGCQTIYYQLWKKLGIRRLAELAKQAIKRGLTKKDLAFTLSAAVRILKKALSGNKVDIDTILREAASVVPGIAEEILANIEKAGKNKANIKETTQRLSLTAQEFAAAIPKDKLGTVAKVALDCASKAKEGIPPKAKSTIIKF